MMAVQANETDIDPTADDDESWRNEFQHAEGDATATVASPMRVRRPADCRVRVAKGNAEPLGSVLDLADLPEPWMVEIQWVKRTEGRGKEGEVFYVPKSCTANAISILANDDRWRGVLARNDFAEADVARKPPPWHEHDGHGARVGQWTDADTTRLRSWLDRAYGITLGANDLERVVGVVAEANRFHPVREYLCGLAWDGTQRLPTLLSTYLGVQPSAYAAAIGVRWMISAVARVMRPGCQVDCTLVLEGPQGIGKSRAVRALVPDPSLYSETGVTPGEKDSYQALHGVWIYLLDELDSLKRGDVTRYKNFLTSPKDHYRESYGRRAKDFYRQNVFAGTTNEAEYLVDRTGNRRFWPVRVVREIDPAAIERDRDQLWAEARVRYESGEAWHVDTPELRALCEAQQAERVQADPWDTLVAMWLENPYRRALDEGNGRPSRAPYDATEGVLTSDVLVHALEIPKGQIGKTHEMRVTSILRDLGYEKGPKHREDGAEVRRWRKVVAPVVAEGGLTPKSRKDSGT